MKYRPDLLDSQSPADMDVIQITDQPGVPASHIYMEARIFTPDSQRLIVHSPAYPHGGKRDDPAHPHRYYLCDLTDACRLSPLTEERGAIAPSVSPEGHNLYYFVHDADTDPRRLELKRVALDGHGRETLLVLNAPLPGADFAPPLLRPYPLSTIAADGQRLALPVHLDTRPLGQAVDGLLVFDLNTMTAALVLHGTDWSNMHAQYCRSSDPEAMHDIMVQQDHERTAARQWGPRGMDIHVIRDDGTRLRDFPWGRDGHEFGSGHQCWRGRGQWAISSLCTRDDPSYRPLVESLAVAHAGHRGLDSPGGIRHRLDAEFPGKPCFIHFGVDAEGTRIVTDAGPFEQGGRLFLATFGDPGTEPLRDWTYLLSPRSSFESNAHIHPFLSPDGTRAFFNSDEAGTLQAYMIQGLPPQGGLRPQPKCVGM